MTIVVHLWQVLAVMTVMLWAGYGMRWWQDRGDYDAGVDEGYLMAEANYAPREDDPADLWGVDDEATAAWIEGLADPLPVLARAHELLDAA